MPGIYIFNLIVIPFIMLIGMKADDQREEKNLLTKSDTKILRGISAVFVVMSHYIVFLWWEGTGNRYVYTIISQLGGIGVLIFFFISGYGIYVSYINREPSWEFVGKRVKVIYLPYVIIKITLEVIKYIAGMQSRALGTALLSILLVEDWFIQVIIMQYIVFFVGWRYAGKARVIWLSLLADCVLSIIFVITKDQGSWFNALWLFTFGMLCGKYEKKIGSFFTLNCGKKVILLLIGFCITGGIFAVFKGEIWANIFKILSGILLCLAICGGNRDFCLNSKVMRVTQYIGERSMHLYIVHLNMWDLTAFIVSPVYRYWAAIGLTIIGTEVLYKVTFLDKRAH